jgi:hypothetical protein
MGTKLSAAQAERRDEGRREVGTVLPVHMQDAATGKDLRGRIHDVSPEGLCVMVRDPLVAGTAVVLVTLKDRYLFRVAWCLPDVGREYRCGLTLDQDRPEGNDLQAVFSQILELSGAQS